VTAERPADRDARLRPFACADSGGLVERGVRVATCADPARCRSRLPVRYAAR
jgi:hypothetical protein